MLWKLEERKPELVDYIGVSYGLTNQLLKWEILKDFKVVFIIIFVFIRFWNRQGFVPVYLRQTANDLTGEHSCIMIKSLLKNVVEDDYGNVDKNSKWLEAYYSGNLIILD